MAINTKNLVISQLIFSQVMKVNRIFSLLVLQVELSKYFAYRVKDNFLLLWKTRQ